MNASGRILSIEKEVLGSTVVIANAGALTMFVNQTDPDFDEKGGQVSINGTVLDYVAVDDDLNTLTMAAVLPATYAVDTRVDVYPHAERLWAYVQVGDEDDDPVIALVPFALTPLVTEGILDDDEHLAAVMEDRGGAWVVTDITGEKPVFSSVTIRNLDEKTPALTIQDQFGAGLEMIRLETLDGLLQAWLDEDGLGIDYGVHKALYKGLAMEMWYDTSGLGDGNPSVVLEQTIGGGQLTFWDRSAGNTIRLRSQGVAFIVEATGGGQGDMIITGARGYINTPANLTGNRNDYDPGLGLGNKFFRVNPNGAARTITGILAGDKGEEIILCNVSGTAGETLTLTHNDAASASNNRFLCPDNASFIIARNGAVHLLYDDISNKWRVIKGPP